MTDASLVAVLGAINVDLVVRGAALPRPGETVVGGAFEEHQGGKGGNQAVAAARALHGGRVAMIGAVGDDALGASARAALRDEGIDVRWVASLPGAATGVALIAVAPGGENQISVAPGANGAVDAETVARALQDLVPTIVLASLEVPTSAVRVAGEWCRDRDVAFMLNPAPATGAVAGLASLARYLTPNAGELAALGGDALAPGAVVIESRGASGVRIHERGVTRDIAAPIVDAIDTTGAGDCLNGVLAAGLAEGRPLDEAVQRAVVAAALSVTVPGAREGMPSRDEIDAALADGA